MSQTQKLFKAAQKAQKFSHSPYSQAKIGAALLTQSGKIFSGCNVENASYGGTVCAERVAIFKAASEVKKLRVREIVVFSDAKSPWPPCGFCRQVLAEFAAPDTIVHLANSSGIKKTYRFAELFPESFNPGHLLK